MSGVDYNGTSYRKGAAGAIREWVGGTLPKADRARSRIDRECRRHAARGRHQAKGARASIYLKDIVKGGLAERFDRFRAIGIRTVMITGDNALTAAAIAKEAGRR